MNIYTLLRHFSHLGGSRMKLAALWMMHIMHRRYLGVFIDTVLTCNYRCQMCYLSNEEERKKRRSGRLTDEQLEAIAHSIFHRALKLQIGCAAEPTMDLKGALRLVQLGKQYGVPYISLTSNGALLKYDKLHELVQLGIACRQCANLNVICCNCWSYSSLLVKLNWLLTTSIITESVIIIT